MKIYHNPRCSKSRQTLALLEEKGINPEIILYLEKPPNQAELKTILSQLAMSAREIMRRTEPEYKEHNLADLSLSDASLIQAMCKFPKLIERPIVIKGNQAILGRPPENVLALL